MILKCLLKFKTRQYTNMALRTKVIQSIEHVKKSTSQGTGGRSRTIKISTKHMNKNKKRSYKKYRGQGR